MNITPFKAVRATKPFVKSFSVSVYDTEAKENSYRLNRNNLHTFLRIMNPQLFYKTPLEPEESAKISVKKLNDLLKEGILEEEQSPAFYIYCQEKNFNVYTGIIGLADIEDYNNSLIKKHELTRAEKEDKMVRFMNGVHANGNPVLMTFKSIPGFNEFLIQKTEADPEYYFTGEDGAWHKLWALKDPEDIKKVQAFFKQAPAYYIADGHHRCAAVSRLYPDVRKFMACFIPAPDLRVHGFHRYLRNLNGIKTSQFLKELQKHFRVQTISAGLPTLVEGVIGLYIKDTWYELHIHESLKKDINPKHNLDVYILDHLIFGKILEIKDTRTSSNIKYINGEIDLKYLAEPVDKHQAKAAFALKGITIDDVIRVSDYNETMPPKSTWIEPKMRSGILINRF